MESRPQIKIVLTTTDKIIEILSWLILLLTWIIVIVNYSKLPATIPTHYNAAGQANGLGGKVSILILPAIATILCIGLTLLNKFPHIFNYPILITKENALEQFSNATKMIRFLKLDVVIIFGFITFRTIQKSRGLADGLGAWFLPVLLIVIFLPMLYFITKAFRNKS